MKNTTALDKPISSSMLIKFSLPTILSMMISAAFMAIDGIFISRILGVRELAAVNLVMPFFTMVLAISSMLSMGGSALVAKKRGEGKLLEARQNFSLIVLVGVFISTVLILGSNIFIDPLIKLMGADSELHGITFEYLRPLSLMLCFPIVGMLLSQFMIADGKPTLGGVSIALGALLNTILNYIFLAPLDMGIQGAAIATGIGYSLPSVIGIVYFIRSRKSNGICFVRPKWDFRVITKSSTNGISEFISMISASVVFAVMNHRLMDIGGELSVAAVGVVLTAQEILAAVFLGYAFGIAPIISYNYGARNTDRLKKAFSCSLKIVTALSMFAMAIGLIFAGLFVRIYIDTSDPLNLPVYEMAKAGFRIYSLGFLFKGFNVFASSLFTALNNGLVSGVLTVFRTFVSSLVLVLLFSYFWGVTGIWASKPFAEVLAIFVSVFFIIRMKNKYQYFGKAVKNENFNKK